MTDEKLYVRCPRCRKILGAWMAGKVVIKHDGREWIGTPDSIRCEKCGGVWMPSAAARASLVEEELRRDALTAGSGA